MPAAYFVIVGKEDCPLYELEFTAQGRKEDQSQLKQFILHASLDVVEELQWGSKELFLKSVDKFNNFSISAYLTAGYVRFLILFDGERKSDDSIKQFFTEVHELWVKIQLNPFYELNATIDSPSFESKIKQLVNRYL
ncbi:trafficking protein particle complex subunit 2 [Acrasis kona]|uniref:Trafficking protein particle complex subunit 2 n=1 Tax=Acrasis kona TaxID=1008807 RepID=A0AAW2ZEK2_9EUKA